MTPDAESIYSRRRSFLRPCPRLFASFGRLSLALLRLPESGQTGPQKPPSPRRRCRFGPKTLLPSAAPWRQPVYHPRPRNAPRSKARPDTLGQGQQGSLATLLRAGDRSVEAIQRRRIEKITSHPRLLAKTPRCFASLRGTSDLEPPRAGRARLVDCC